MESSKTKSNAYGTSNSDTSFRRTWNKEEYAAKGAERDAKTREDGKAQYEAKLAGKKYIRRASTPPDAKFAEARTKRLDVASRVGQTTLVPAGAGTGKRGKSAGFYCEACDLTFKDNLQFLDHENSQQHLIATGQTGKVERATIEQVRQTLAWLKRKRDEEDKGDITDLKQRLEDRAEEEERLREERRERTREKRRKIRGEKNEVGIKKENNEKEFDSGILS
ncbi:hypothetical protein MMC25_004320 [Agyrium rufum]|nr:hypothetical protein [Agyrium rufum]